MNDYTHPGTRAATELELAACADEPIHIPGKIQPHGALLAAVDLRVTHASANLGIVTGNNAQTAIGKPIAEILGHDTLRALLTALDTEHYSPVSLVQQSLRLPGVRRYNLLCHRSNDRIIVEIEQADPHSTQQSALALAQSVHSTLRQKQSMAELCDHVARELRRLTGYDRVMVYQFDKDGNGHVVAEDRVADIAPFLGLHYPATDIPAQARRLYMLQRVRVLPDVNHDAVPVLADAGLAAPDLDMSHCMLRAVSPVHLEYLRNMDVGATLGLSIIQENTLWGMVVCHHRTGLKPSLWIVSLCDLIGQLLSLLVGEITEREALSLQVERQKKLSVITGQLEYRASIIEGLAGQTEHILKLVDAEGVVIFLGGKTVSLGKIPPIEIAFDMVTRMRPESTDATHAIDNLGEQFPDYRPFKDCATGILVLPLGTTCDDGVIWFRPEMLRAVDWGGDPQNKAVLDLATFRLSPRKSFNAWREIVAGKAKPWTKIDIQAARDLRRVLTRALLRHSEAEVFRISNTDPLTGLANRRVLNERLAAWRASYPQSTAALLFLDLDRFKTVNDSLGHFAGDELLHETARRLAVVGPDRYLLVRLGGDEFVVFAEHISETEAESLAQRILDLFIKPFVALGRPYRATVSIGIAYAATSRDDLMRDADAAMYDAKRRGGNRAVMFQKSIHEVASHRMRTEQDLFMALERGEMTVNYQPIVTLPGGLVYAHEALARWHHPELGWMAPLDFIRLAEETSQIERIGGWVAREAIRQLADLPDRSLRMSINVSAHQLRFGGIVQDVTDTLALYNIVPNRIVIEVTESTLMDDTAVRSLELFRGIGCGVAVDDFGTGYSSLAYLKRLPVTAIKIDRSFVTPLGADLEAEHFLEAIINLAHALGLYVIAEGVETVEQRDVLIRLRCDAAQGYLFGRPQAAIVTRA